VENQHNQTLSSLWLHNTLGDLVASSRKGTLFGAGMCKHVLLQFYQITGLVSLQEYAGTLLWNSALAFESTLAVLHSHCCYFFHTESAAAAAIAAAAAAAAGTSSSCATTAWWTPRPPTCTHTWRVRVQEQQHTLQQ
jgi:hypothetical protein